jgi:hypothetical protein
MPLSNTTGCAVSLAIGLILLGRTVRADDDPPVTSVAVLASPAEATSKEAAIQAELAQMSPVASPDLKTGDGQQPAQNDLSCLLEKGCLP